MWGPNKPFESKKNGLHLIELENDVSGSYVIKKIKIKISFSFEFLMKLFKRIRMILLEGLGNRCENQKEKTSIFGMIYSFCSIPYEVYARGIQVML